MGVSEQLLPRHRAEVVGLQSTPLLDNVVVSVVGPERKKTQGLKFDLNVYSPKVSERDTTPH